MGDLLDTDHSCNVNTFNNKQRRLNCSRHKHKITRRLYKHTDILFQSVALSSTSPFLYMFSPGVFLSELL